MRNIEELLNELQSISIDYNDLNKSFKDIQKIYFEIYRNHIQESKNGNLKKGTKLYRVRKNPKDLRFDHLNELFAPPPHMTYFGRVNLKHSPVYYCSDNDTTSILESKLEEGDYFTLIENILLEDLDLLVLGDCNRYKLDKRLSIELEKLDKVITELISQNITKSEDYLFTATLGNTLMSDQSYHGLMFPSIYSEKLADNYALRIDRLKEHLMFENARLFRVNKKIDAFRINIECIGNSNRVSATSNFIWTKVNNCNSHEIFLDKNTLKLE